MKLSSHVNSCDSWLVLIYGNYVLGMAGDWCSRLENGGLVYCYLLYTFKDFFIYIYVYIKRTTFRFELGISFERNFCTHFTSAVSLIRIHGNL